MKKLRSIHFYLLAIALTIAGNYIVPRDSFLYYIYGFICISIVTMAIYKQFKGK